MPPERVGVLGGGRVGKGGRVCACSCVSYKVKTSNQTHCRIPDDDNDIQRIVVYVCVFYSYNQQATEDKFLWSYLISVKDMI